MIIVMVALAGLQGTLWINSEQVTAVYPPPQGYCERAANSVVESSGGKAYCVKQTPEQVIWMIEELRLGEMK